MSSLFYFLCGVLYVLGLPFGWNYEETSVYVCIYAFPFLVVLPFIVMVVRMLMLIIYGRRKIFGSMLLIVSLFLLYMVSGMSYVYFDIFNIDGSIHEKFLFCMNYLSNYAGRIGMTYEELNMAIYVIAPLTGFLTLLFIYMLSLFCKKKKMIVAK